MKEIEIKEEGEKRYRLMGSWRRRRSRLLPLPFSVIDFRVSLPGNRNLKRDIQNRTEVNEVYNYSRFESRSFEAGGTQEKFTSSSLWRPRDNVPNLYH